MPISEARGGRTVLDLLCAGGDNGNMSTRILRRTTHRRLLRSSSRALLSCLGASRIKFLLQAFGAWLARKRVCWLLPCCCYMNIFLLKRGGAGLNGAAYSGRERGGRSGYYPYIMVNNMVVADLGGLVGVVTWMYRQTGGWMSRAAFVRSLWRTVATCCQTTSYST